MSAPDAFVTWAELPNYKVPQYCRRHINDMVDRGVFPPPVRLSANRIAWRLSDLETWKATRPAPGEPLPTLWPVRVREPGRGGPQTDFSKPRGRPPGSRVVDHKLIRPEELESADVAA